MAKLTLRGMREKGWGCMMENWYAVQVKTGKEEETAELCRKIVDGNILTESFIPKYERMKRYQGEWHKEQLTMFPGYIFLVTDRVEELFQELKTVPELTKILGTGGEFIPIRDQEKTLLQRLGNEKHVTEMSKGCIVGEQAVILSGPMKGLEGKIRKIDRHKRTAVLEAGMFGRQVDVKVGLEIVERL